MPLCLLCRDNQLESGQEVCSDCTTENGFLCPNEECDDTKETLKKLRLHHASAHGTKLPNKICKACNEGFHSRDTRYCENCEPESKLETTSCQRCEKKYSYYPSKSNGTFCSDCYDEKQEEWQDSSDRQPGEIELTSDLEDEPMNKTDLPENRLNKPKVRGEITESIIKAEFMRLGYSILSPEGDSNSFDLVVYDGNKFHRIQCKTANYKNGSIKFETRTRGWSQEDRTYKGAIDYFVVYCKTTDSVYVIPIDECGAAGKTLRVEEPKNPTPHINWASEYTIDEYF